MMWRDGATRITCTIRMRSNKGRTSAERPLHGSELTVVAWEKAVQESNQARLGTSWNHRGGGGGVPLTVDS